MTGSGRRIHYGKLPGLKDVYLEDSYVLDVDVEASHLKLTLQAVLRENHPSYRPPQSPDRYCYRLAVLEFRGVEAIHWSRRSKLKYRDARGRIDYGNVDVLYRAEDGSYHVEGDWGVVDLVSAAPIVTLAG